MPSEFTVTRRVEFHETDMAGIMHFTNYFRWMEICETTFFRTLGIPVIASEPGQTIGWPRVDVSCEYHAPLRFNDSVEVKLAVKKIGTRSITYRFQFHHEGVLCARGEMTAVCVALDAKAKQGIAAQPIPAEIRAKLQAAPE
jgi:acyl-CoA thioester hydrolase